MDDYLAYRRWRQHRQEYRARQDAWIAEEEEEERQQKAGQLPKPSPGIIPLVQKTS